MGKQNMQYQVKMLADEFDGRGQSKYEAKQLARQEGVKTSERTRDLVYAQRSRNEFLRVNTKFAEYCKQTFSDVNRLGDIKPEHFTQYWQENSYRWLSTTQSAYRDHLMKMSYFISKKGWGRGFINSQNRPEIKGYKSIHKRTDRALPWDEKSIQKLKSEISQEYKNVITVLAETGIRAIEMQRIKIKDIDLKNKQLHLVRKMVVKDDGKLRVIGSGKGARPRTVPLSDEAICSLRNEINKNGLEDPGDKVFSRIKTNTLRKVIQQFNGKYGNPKRSLHSFRHYYATKKFREKYTEERKNGVPVKTAISNARAYVSHLLGHGRVNEDQGRIGVTYAYLSSNEMYEMLKEIEVELNTNTPDGLKYKGF